MISKHMIELVTFTTIHVLETVGQTSTCSPFISEKLIYVWQEHKANNLNNIKVMNKNKFYQST